MKVTEEQVVEIGVEIYKAEMEIRRQHDTTHWSAYPRRIYLQMGRAALAKVAGIALAEPTEEEIDAALKQANGGHCWAMRILFENRLRSLLGRERDEAVEAIRRAVGGWGSVHLTESNAEMIVAAVRNADAAQKKVNG